MASLPTTPRLRPAGLLQPRPLLIRAYMGPFVVPAFSYHSGFPLCVPSNWSRLNPPQELCSITVAVRSLKNKKTFGRGRGAVGHRTQRRYHAERGAELALKINAARIKSGGAAVLTASIPGTSVTSAGTRSARTTNLWKRRNVLEIFR